MQKARGHPLVRRPIGLPQCVGTWFQVLFTPLNGVLFTFPSRYWFTIGHQLVFSLGRWSSRLPTGFPVSRGTRERRPGRPILFVYRTITFCGGPSQALRLGMGLITSRGIRRSLRQRPATPEIQCLRAWHISGLGYSHFARHYFGNRSCFLFLGVLRCFSSPRSPLQPMDSAGDVRT